MQPTSMITLKVQSQALPQGQLLVRFNVLPENSKGTSYSRTQYIRWNILRTLQTYHRIIELNASRASNDPIFIFNQLRTVRKIRLHLALSARFDASDLDLDVRFISSIHSLDIICMKLNRC